MRAIDCLKALGVAFAVLVITMVASYPMVTFYATFVEPGHPQEFYIDAAQWIAPWSSHILGPIIFFAFNYWLARRSPQRNAMGFAAATVLFYVIIDLSTLPMMGIPLAAVLNATVIVSLGVKGVGACLGAHLGSRSSGVSGVTVI